MPTGAKGAISARPSGLASCRVPSNEIELRLHGLRGPTRRWRPKRNAAVLPVAPAAGAHRTAELPPLSGGRCQTNFSGRPLLW
jgi:hypothetical protein